MAKADVVAAGVAAIQQGEIQVYTDQLGGAYDMGFSDGQVGASPGSFTQADIDAAVQSAKDADAQVLAQAQAADAQALIDAQAQAQQSLADIQAKLDSLTAKEAPEAALIASLQSAKDSLAQALAAITAALGG